MNHIYPYTFLPKLKIEEAIIIERSISKVSQAQDKFLALIFCNWNRAPTEKKAQ